MIKNEKGAAAIEFAIVLPLFLILTFGTIEFGCILYDKAILTNASREGARLGIYFMDAQLLTENEIIDNIKDRIVNECLYNIAESRLVNLGGAQISKTDLRDLIEVPPLVGNIRTVTVKYPYEFLLIPNFVPGIPDKLTISATTKMRMEES